MERAFNLKSKNEKIIFNNFKVISTLNRLSHVFVNKNVLHESIDPYLEGLLFHDKYIELDFRTKEKLKIYFEAKYQNKKSEMSNFQR